MESPPAYTERSSLLDRGRAQSVLSDDGHRDIAWRRDTRPTYADVLSSRPSRDRKSDKFIVGCNAPSFIWFLFFVGITWMGLFWRPWNAMGPAPYVWQVAIIGAGPAGASAAHNIRKFANEEGIIVNITVYEKSDYIGGRATHRVTYNNGDDDYSIQIAARGFHTSNRILVDTASELNLEPVMLDGTQDTDLSGRSGGQWGVFDGHSIIYRQSHPTNFLTGWWWSLKLYYFYGSSPSNTKATVTATLSKLDRIYSPRFFPFTSLSAVIRDLGLQSETSLSGTQLLNDNGVSTAFQKDLVNSWVRRDFGQNLGQLSALAAMTAPDDGGDMTVTGGHWSLFEKMVKDSKAEALLKMTAVGMRKMDWGGWIIAAHETGIEDGDPQDWDYREFDSVIIATPYQFSGLETKGDSLKYLPPQIEYTPLHVTLFKSTIKLSAPYFGFNGEVPETLLTTLAEEEYEELSGRKGKEGVGSTGFYQLTSVKRFINIDAMGDEVEEFLYKVVSPEELEDEKIYKMFGAEKGRDRIITWIHRHKWESAFPVIYPRSKFAELTLDENMWYTGGIEELSSSMELSSLMGANVAKLVMEGWEKEGRGKRPDRCFEESKNGEKTLWPETMQSYLRAVYEGIWNDNPEGELANVEDEDVVEVVEVETDQFVAEDIFEVEE